MTLFRFRSEVRNAGGALRHDGKRAKGFGKRYFRAAHDSKRGQPEPGRLRECDEEWRGT